MNKLLIATLALLVLVMPVQAQDVDYLDITKVKIDGTTVDNGETLFVERGDTLDIEVSVRANDTRDVEAAQLQTFLAGYRYADVERNKVTDFSDTFRLPAGNTRRFDFTIDIPQDIDQKNAKLRILAADENSPGMESYEYQLNIEGLDEKNAVQIRDFVTTPSSTVEAGRAIGFLTRVQNYGTRDINDASITVSIPELGLRDFESISELDSDETRTFESMILRIPPGTPSGTYTVEAQVEFDRFRTTTVTETITVEGEDAEAEEPAEETTRVTVPEQISVRGGESALFPIVIQNDASSSKTYVLSESGVSNWGSATFEPGNVVNVAAGQSETVQLRLNADENASGQQTFNVNIESGDDETSFNALVDIKEAQQEEKGTDLRTVLEWALVLLIAVLVILGLVLLFKKDKEREPENPDEEEPDYY